MKGLRDITNNLRSLKERFNDYIRFTLKRSTLEDLGTYCILAKNIYGCDRAFFTVVQSDRRCEIPFLNLDNSYRGLLRNVHKRDYLRGKIKIKTASNF